MKKKPYWEMTTAELAEATKEYDKPFAEDLSRPLTPEEKKRWRRVKRKRGRPKNGLGFQRVTISMERGLLSKVNALAKKRKVSRSRLLAIVLEEAISSN